jgi:hypothetical protein
VLEIRELLIPHFVENGTEDSVVLDCIYSLDEIDDRKLVVKWFLNDDPEPIYQWIAELGTPTTSGRLHGRINLDYTVNSADPLIKYRALNLLRPTIDLSGRYSCHVQSLKSHDSQEETMIVYGMDMTSDPSFSQYIKFKIKYVFLPTAKPKDIEFNYKPVTIKEYSAALRKHKTKHNAEDNSYSYNGDEQYYSSSSSSELFCKVTDVYPMPELTIYRVAPDGSHPRTLDIIRKEAKPSSNGAYNASVSVFINDRELIEKYGDEPSVFECLVVLNEINHEKRKRITYFPGMSFNLLSSEKIFFGTFNKVLFRYFMKLFIFCAYKKNYLLLSYYYFIYLFFS